MICITGDAENYRYFISKFFNKLSTATINLCKKQLPKSWETEGGLYLIVAQTSKNVPEYIGITGRNFKERISRHMTSGIANKIRKRIEKPDVIVSTIPMDLPVAKFFESVFLEAFDFRMNTEENGQIRKNYDFKGRAKYPAEGFRVFKIKYDRAFSKMQSLHERIHNIKWKEM